MNWCVCDNCWETRVKFGIATPYKGCYDKSNDSGSISISENHYKNLLRRDTNHQRVLGFLSGLASGLQYCEDPVKATKSINSFLEKMGEK